MRLALAHAALARTESRARNAVVAVIDRKQRRFDALAKYFRLLYLARFDADLIAPRAQPRHRQIDHPRAHRLQATIEAIMALYGIAGLPPGITEGRRFEQINRWLREHGRACVSQPTIRRAMKSLRRRERN